MADQSQKQKQSQPSKSTDKSADDRRHFLVKAAAVVVGGLVGIVPLASGLFTFFDPVRRKSGSTELLRVTSLDAVPDDGIPRPFRVFRDLVDGWNVFPNEPVGTVYLRRMPGATDKVECFHATCPHLGCAVDFNAEAKQFQCPCHNSAFEPDGERIDPDHCPSPRDLDTLDAPVKNGEVFVEFKNYKAATPDKIPVG
jgi:menaquinol-cytochrome c reductase iron-sulfur subunit